MTMFDHDLISGAFASSLGGRQFDGKPIRADMVLGEVRPPAVVIAPPGLGFDELGEGWVVDAVEYPLHLFTGSSRGEVRLDRHYAFVEAVLQALMDDPTLGGAVVGTTPIDAPQPEEVEVRNRDGKSVRKLFRQIVTVRVDL